jgi:hypothetical protein
MGLPRDEMELYYKVYALQRRHFSPTIDFAEVLGLDKQASNHGNMLAILTIAIIESDACSLASPR